MGQNHGNEIFMIVTLRVLLQAAFQQKFSGIINIKKIPLEMT